MRQTNVVLFSLRLIHITAFSACVCGRRLHCSAEIEKFLSLRWRSPLRNPQTAAASVNEPYKNIFSIKFLFVGFECSDCWKFWLKIKKSQSENWKVLHRIVSWVPVERGQSLMQNFAARESVRPNSVQNCFRSKLNNFPCYKNIGTIIFYILSIISMSY